MTRRLLVVQEHFVQGFGGIPECTLLLAKSLVTCGARVDVLSKEGLLEGVAALEVVPFVDSSFQDRRRCVVGSYDGMLISGAWNPLSIMMAIRSRLSGIPLSYAPKGNLSKIEFGRPRDLKKIPYLLLAEIVPLALAKRILFESSLEHDHCVLPRWFVRARGVVLPEPFRGPKREDPNDEPDSDSHDIHFGFLAEISPRKGLKELIEGFLVWTDRYEFPVAQLFVAGEPRPGSAAYLKSIMEVLANHRSGPRIVWCGPRRGPVRNEFYRDLDFFICPSRFESFGLTPIEALWEGTPVLCGSCLGCLEFLDPSPAVKTFSLEPTAIADALEKACRDRQSARLAAAEYHEKISTNFQGDGLTKSYYATLFG